MFIRWIYCWCIIIVGYVDSFDESILVTIVHPQKGARWQQNVLVDLDIDVKNGQAAKTFRQAPFSFITCLTGGENSDIKCRALMDTDPSFLDLVIDPIFDGVAIITAWVQSKQFHPHISRAIGKPSYCYLWDSPEEAVIGLNHRLRFVTDRVHQSQIEEHLGIANMQLSNHWRCILGSIQLPEVDDILTDVVNIMTPEVVEVDSNMENVEEPVSVLLEQVAIVTISNKGYVDLTLNCMASLRVKCDMPCVLQVVCLDEECTERLRSSSETANCPDTIQTVTASEMSSDLEDFSSYKKGSFNDIVKFKFIAIEERLRKYEFVLFTDGDVVFLTPDFLPQVMSAAKTVDVVAMCDLMGPVYPQQVCATTASILNADGSTTVKSVDYLCTGFFVIRSNPTTLREFSPKVVFGDPSYTPNLHDQEYFNMVTKHKLNYASLDRGLFPNGSPYAYHSEDLPPPPENPCVIHYNYFPGKNKLDAMKERGHWFLNTEPNVTVDEEENETLLLHIGGQERRTGWTVVDIAEHEATDVVSAMDDLSAFREGSASCVYASHVLEHSSYKRLGDSEESKGESPGLGLFSGSEMARALSEWRRVLRPGGLLLLAVPDLPTLAQLYINGGVLERSFLMRVIYGGQENQHDFHSVGFDFELIAMILVESGFCAVTRLDGEFGLFQDTAGMSVFGTPISLNVVATACQEPQIDAVAQRRTLVEMIFATSGVTIPEHFNQMLSI